jgi:hypothetical protein
MVADLLREFVREPWVGQLDFSTLERVSSSFVSEDSQQRYNDVVWRLLWRRDGREPLPMYVLVEFQSTPYRFMAVRLLTYLSLLYEHLIRDRTLLPSGKLPPVLLLVVYNGNRRWGAPRRLEALVEPAPGILGQSCPRFGYEVLDEKRVPPGKLGNRSNLMVALIRLEVSGSTDELLGVAKDLAVQLPPGREPELRRAFTSWVLRLLRRSHPGARIPEVAELEEIPMIEENLIRWNEQKLRKARQEGRKEGRAEGRLEGRRAILLRQLELRFGPLPAGVRERVEEISSSQRLNALSEKVLTVGSLEEMGLG